MHEPHLALLSRFALHLNQRHIQALDLLHGLARDTLEIAVKAGGGIEHAVELLLAFGPQPRHGGALALEIGLHFGEFFDDGLDAVAEAWAGEVRVHHLGLGLLTFLCLSAGGDVDQRLPECDSERNGEARLRDPNVVNEVEALDFLRYDARDDQRDVRFRSALIIAQLGQPGVVPGLRSF